MPVIDDKTVDELEIIGIDKCLKDIEVECESLWVKQLLQEISSIWEINSGVVALANGREGFVKICLV